MKVTGAPPPRFAELKICTGASAVTDGLGARLVCDAHNDRKSERNTALDIGSSACTT